MPVKIPLGFDSPGGRHFAVSSQLDKHKRGYLIFHDGKEVGTLHRTTDYGPAFKWMITTRQLAWSGELPPLGIGFDGSPKATVNEALAQFGRIADDVLDWRAGRGARVRRLPHLFGERHAAE